MDSKGAVQYTVALHGVWILLLLAGGLAASAEVIHEPSGLRFPASIEGRYQLQPPAETARPGKKMSVAYLARSGQKVAVAVYPAKKDTKGPARLDGDERSDPSAAFKEEQSKIIREISREMDNPQVVSQMRFQAAIHQKGPVGMKTVVKGIVKKEGVSREFLLFERNGFLVRFDIEYPTDRWPQLGLGYTDVAHFIGWPTLR